LIASAAEAVAEHTGPAGLAGLVNNAGIGVFSPVELTPLADFRRLLEVNVTGQLAVTQAFLPLLRLAQGRIVMIGSIGVRVIPPYVGPLAASKSELDTLANALRQELALWNIGVSTVDPASIHSEAVGKLDQDLENLLVAAMPSRRSLYEESLRRLVRIFARQYRAGSPEVAAKSWRTP
jgi:NAD(P)-dependent dehydrogenase (short-subunit alcohol dehydrogenase family)